MEEGIAKGKSAFVGEWVIKDKYGNIKEQGIDIQEGGEEGK